MTTSTEKLRDLRDHLEPQLAEVIDQGKGGMAASMAISFLLPIVEGKLDEFLARPPDEHDEILINIIDIAGRHLSDDARPFAVGPAGVDGGACIDGYVGTVQLEQLEPDPVRGSHPAGGGDGLG